MDIKLSLSYYVSIMLDAFKGLLYSSYTGIIGLGLPAMANLWLQIITCMQNITYIKRTYLLQNMPRPCDGLTGNSLGNPLCNWT